jgi:hypothetical protein
VDFSVEAAELVDLVGDWALTVMSPRSASAVDQIACGRGKRVNRSSSGRHPKPFRSKMISNAPSTVDFDN